MSSLEEKIEKLVEKTEKIRMMLENLTSALDG